MAMATTPPSDRPQICARSTSERVHRGEDRGGKIVAGRAFGREIALAIAGIIERNRAPARRRNAPSCGRHTPLSEPTPWRKTIGVRCAAAGLGEADRSSVVQRVHRAIARIYGVGGGLCNG